MAKYTLKVNGKNHEVDVDPATPLLWVLREHLNMVGTKYGCGVGSCGACTILYPVLLEELMKVCQLYFLIYYMFLK